MITRDTLRKHSWLIQEWVEEGRRQGMILAHIELAIDARFPDLHPEYVEPPTSITIEELATAFRRLLAAKTTEEAREVLASLREMSAAS